LQNDKFGLLNIVVRMSYLEGNASIHSLLGKGTIVILTAPRKSRGH
jgi:hypothetical protein